MHRFALRLRNEVKKYAPFFVVEDDRVNYAHLARASSNSVASAAVALSAPMPSDNKDTRRPNSTGVVLSHAASSGPLLNRPEQHERPVKNYDPNFGIDITSLHVSASASSYHTDRRGMRAGATAGKSASDISRPRTPPPHQTYGHGPLSNSQTTVKTSGVPHTRHQSDQTHLNGRVGINSLGNPYSHNTLTLMRPMWRLKLPVQWAETIDCFHRFLAELQHDLLHTNRQHRSAWSRTQSTFS
ncbi:hypothetical protein BASA81_013872 [Batrachochytrium salamandrivorans]|nr:hypothetical protein BASA81_013872 [Batrachochytrium salamandrivorans]